MSEIKYLGNGWENKYGDVYIALNIQKLNDAINNGDLEINNYGDVKINVKKMKAINEKSKATHSVSVPNFKKQEVPF